MTSADKPADLQKGTLVMDMKTGRVGVFMAREGGKLYLRPKGGGCEWEVDPDEVEPADPHEELSAKVAEANAITRWAIRAETEAAYAARTTQQFDPDA